MRCGAMSSTLQRAKQRLRAASSSAGHVALRPDKRPRPLILRMNVRILTISFQNLLNPARGNDNHRSRAMSDCMSRACSWSLPSPMTAPTSAPMRAASAAPGQEALLQTLCRAGERISAIARLTDRRAGRGGALAFGLFGAVNVEPVGAEYYRSELTNADLRIATVGTSPTGQPLLNYDAVYPVGHPQAGAPVLKILQGSEIVVPISTPSSPARRAAISQRDIPAQPDPGAERQRAAGAGTALASARRAIPRVLGRLPRRDFRGSGLPRLLQRPRFDHTLGRGCRRFRHQLRHRRHRRRDPGQPPRRRPEWRRAPSASTRSSSSPPGRSAIRRWSSTCRPTRPARISRQGRRPPAAAPSGRKATKAFYPDDPSNVHHSYISDHVKFRMLHAGPKEHHIHHLHAHQWLYTPDSEKSSYLDSQAIGPGSASPPRSPTTAAATATRLSATRSSTATSIRTSPRACGSCGAVHDIFESGHSARCERPARRRLACLARTPRSWPARRSRRSCRCPTLADGADARAR